MLFRSNNEMCYSTKTQTFSPTKHTLRKPQNKLCTMHFAGFTDEATQWQTCKEYIYPYKVTWTYLRTIWASDRPRNLKAHILYEYALLVTKICGEIIFHQVHHCKICFCLILKLWTMSHYHSYVIVFKYNFFF